MRDLNLLNSSKENVFSDSCITQFFEFNFENREINFKNHEGFTFFFLMSAERIKIDNQNCIYISIRNVTDFVSYKNIFEELYNSLSSKTIELDNVLTEKDKAYRLLKMKDEEMLRQLNLARDIQRGLFPELNKNLLTYQVATKIQPVTMVSGDMVQMWEESGRHIDILIADVTGHGVPAALITMLLKMSIQNSVGMISKPVDVIKKLHNDLHNILSNSGIFITLLYMRIDTHINKAFVYNCGHPAPIIIKKEGKVEMHEVGGIMLGVVEELDYGASEINLDKEDTILLLTDGITEASNDEDVFYEDLFYKTLSECGGKSPQEIINIVTSSLETFMNGAENQDDITLVCLNQNR